MWASLPMYDRPEMVSAHDRFWAVLRDVLLDAGVEAPDTLRHGPEAMDWENSTMLLSQTCGMPYRMGLHESVTLVGTPDYGVEGCPPGFYRSALVARKGEERSLATLLKSGRTAFNMRHSQSGFAALHAHAMGMGISINPQVETGSHLASAQAVAQDRVDIAALDAVSWRLIQRYDDFAKDLIVVDWTKPTPGLPLITAFPDLVPLLQKAFAQALKHISPAQGEALGIRGLATISPEAYFAEAGAYG